MPAPANAKKPQDRKKKATERPEPFVYETSAGTVTLPLLTQMKFGTVRRIRKLDQGEVIFALAEEMADEESLAVLDELYPDEVGKLYEAWEKASEDAEGVDVGESSASAS